MAQEKSNFEKIKINEKQFSRYTAQDSHGSNCEHCSIDGVLVSKTDFFEEIRKELLTGGYWLTKRVIMEDYFKS